MGHSKRKSNTISVVQLMEMPNGGASDLVFKKDIVEVSSALNRILALRPVTWHWKSDTDEQNLQHGFIAQEVEKIFPELVEVREQDNAPYKFLLTKGLLPYLVKAIEEQQAQIDALRQELEKK